MNHINGLSLFVAVVTLFSFSGCATPSRHTAQTMPNEDEFTDRQKAEALINDRSTWVDPAILY